MWNRSYQFGGIIIRIDSEIEYKESEKFEKFKAERNRYDFKIYIKSGVIPLPLNEQVQRKSGYCKWLDGESKYSIRYMSTSDGMQPYAFTKECETEAIQIYSEDGLRYLDTRLIFEGFDFFGLLNRLNSVVLHASYIRYGERGILFSGPSGMGKSTQANLWLQYREAQVINGDRTLIRKDEGKFKVHGICYAGTSGICENVSVPLETIIILRKATRNKIRKMGGKEAFCELLPQCAYYKENGKEMAVLTATLAELINKVPVYLLECTPDKKAVEMLESVL